METSTTQPTITREEVYAIAEKAIAAAKSAGRTSMNTGEFALNAAPSNWFSEKGDERDASRYLSDYLVANGYATERDYLDLVRRGIVSFATPAIIAEHAVAETRYRIAQRALNEAKGNITTTSIDSSYSEYEKRKVREWLAVAGYSVDAKGIIQPPSTINK